MTKISIYSKEDIDEFDLIDLYGNTTTVVNTLDTELAEGWWEIVVPFDGEQNEIYRIAINDVDIDHLLYTGFTENEAGERFSPGCAVWEPGVWKLWFHTNQGFWKHTVFSQVANGDYGLDLFEDYMFTVDRSTEIEDSYLYPGDVVDFFKYPFGPRWWKKDDITLPYKILDNPGFDEIDRNTLIDELKEIAEVKQENASGWWAWSLKDASDFPTVPLDEFTGHFRKLLDLVGYTSVIDFSLLTLESQNSIPIHVDDHVNRDAWPAIAGCKKFYWTLANKQGNLFKLGEAGIVPTDQPLLVNSAMHTHSLINDTNNNRAVLIIYGEIDDGSTFKGLKLQS